MAQMTMLVGTVGQGIMRSPDGGETWRRVGIGQGLHSDALVRALVNDPRQPEIVFAGTDKGLYRSDNAGETWTLLDAPLRDYAVWALTIDAHDAHVMYAGTGTPTPSTLYRSDDGGMNWQRCAVDIAKECPNVGVPRITGIAIDPLAQQNVWVGIEVDGVRHSRNGGKTWNAINGAIPNPDVHNVLVVAGPPKTVFVLVNNEVYTSVDDGANWKALHIRDTFPWTYPRGIAVHPHDPKTVFVTIGDATPGRIGAIMRSRDAGQTWEHLALPVQANSAIWVVHMQPANPDIVLAGSRYGYLYRSDDGGDSWAKSWREFSEISSIAWIPG
jgi:photosystem II stability/assembly factor-like uncharacterized protein